VSRRVEIVQPPWPCDEGYNEVINEARLGKVHDEADCACSNRTAVFANSSSRGEVGRA
jgi:hypothetical protein